MPLTYASALVKLCQSLVTAWVSESVRKMSFIPVYSKYHFFLTDHEHTHRTPRLLLQRLLPALQGAVGEETLRIRFNTPIPHVLSSKKSLMTKRSERIEEKSDAHQKSKTRRILV